MSLASLLKKGSLHGLATATPATPATDRSLIPQSVATVATVAVAKAPDGAANDPAQVPDLVTGETAVTPDPDRWCWPHSTAMNTAEIDTLSQRLHQFARRGMTEPEAETMANKLVIRDRESDDRRLCLECSNLSRGSGWRCSQWQRAGLSAPGVPVALVRQLQRCDSFNFQNSQRTTS